MTDLYNVRVEGLVKDGPTWQRRQLITMIGSRETVIEASLRVILDCAPFWNQASYPSPGYTIDVQRVAE